MALVSLSFFYAKLNFSSHPAVKFLYITMLNVKTNDLITLNSGRSIPAVGLGVYQIEPAEAQRSVKFAFNSGYRHADSAKAYRNERDTIEGILQFMDENEEYTRDDIFYTTKLPGADHGYNKAKLAIHVMIEQLRGHSNHKDKHRNLHYIDLILIHSPLSNREKRLGTWKALEEAVATGKVKSIGVSNYGIPHLKELLTWDDLEIKPAVNQLELHPWLQRRELIEYMREHDIKPEAYSPLTRGKMFDDPTLVELGKKYNKSPAQILVKWSLYSGFIPLPKSVHENRIKENIDVDDFELTKEEYESLGDKDAYKPVAWDPTTHPVDDDASNS